MEIRGFILVVALSVTTLTCLQAQDDAPFRAGFHLRGLGGDFGLGVNLDLPVSESWPIFRLAGTWQWQEVPDGSSFDVESYQTLRLGIASRSFAIQDRIRAYGEGGFMGIFAGNALSEDSFAPGAYGLFGFEFFVDTFGGSALFLEIGGSSAGSRINLQPGVQRFGAGLWVGAGFRIAL